MTGTARQIEMNAIPAMASMLLRTATTRKKKQLEPTFLPLAITARGVRADRNKLQKFRQVCGFSDEGNLPLTYPHIMAFALHLQLMLEPEFPFSPIGAVHIRNRIRQQRAIKADESLDFSVRFEGAEQVRQGYEISFVTEVRINDELTWDDLSVMLVRKGGSGAKKDRVATPLAPDYQQSVSWQLATNKGREYAAASGDYNLIHLYPLSAKLMGFKRHIMHGMWSKSRAIAHLLPKYYQGPASVDVAFKLPIFLPATITLLFNSDDNGSVFELKDGNGKKPHLAGELRLGAGISD